jgi:integral membrane protein
VPSALTRYRVMAYVVGVLLVLLVVVGMPLKYLGDQDAVVATVGPVHGFMYVLYLLTVLDLTTRHRWTWTRAVGVMLAGTIPFVSFYAEHRVTRDVRAAERAEAPTG